MHVVPFFEGYVLVNMFFAIIAKHFQKEDQVLEEQRLERSSEDAPGSRSAVEEIKVPFLTFEKPWKSVHLLNQQVY